MNITEMLPLMDMQQLVGAHRWEVLRRLVGYCAFDPRAL